MREDADTQADGTMEERSVDADAAEPADGSFLPPEETETAVLESLRDESREVLDHRIDLLRETDEKVAKTVRTAVLVLSVTISTASIGGVETMAEVPGAAIAVGGLAVAGLFVTVIYGLVAYSSSERILGLDRAFRREPRCSPYSKREWLVLLTVGYDEWIAEVKQVNDMNANRLRRVRVLLLSSLFALFIAVGLLLGTS